MCTTDTGDTEGTAQQTLRLVQAGCEIVRVTVPNMQDAHALEPLRRRLEQLGVTVPLVADIHFNPHAAIVAADFVEKVRVNPGNYVDVKKFAVREYTDAEYAAELDRIRERFVPLVEKCKRLGRAMRIGTNHGSLSDRIMNRYGDSALGMVESALEFVRLCEEQDYRDVVISMKSSNAFVAVEAYRLLAERMRAEDMAYPFHLGVTEAGNGEDGRVKSAVGIGSLLADGLGDTVRVSLTEDPEHEVPVAFALVAPYNARLTAPRDPDAEPDAVPAFMSPGQRRATAALTLGARQVGGRATVSTWVNLGSAGDADLAARVREFVAPPGSDAPLADVAWLRLDQPADLAALDRVRPALWTPDGRIPLAVTAPLALLADDGARVLGSLAATVLLRADGVEADAGGEAARAVQAAGASFGLWFESAGDASDGAAANEPLAREAVRATLAVREATGATPLLAFAPPGRASAVFTTRMTLAALAQAGADDAPVLLVDRAAESAAENALLRGAEGLGGLLVDGIGDAVLILGPPATSLSRALGLLQATRLRMTRADYIACPSCGRTLFDLQEVTARIQRTTSHLVGVKIAIMGCIVNGPGEMADADFGYVGSAPGKINLYVGKDCVARNVPAAEADDRLIALIKEHGRWSEPAAVAAGGNQPR